MTAGMDRDAQIMAAMDRDAHIMAEAEKQRQHERAMAEVDARRHSDTERQMTLRRESRHQTIAWVFGIGGVLGVIITIILSIANATSEDRAKELKIKEQQNSVAETCIRDGNIWLNGDCIPSQK